MFYTHQLFKLFRYTTLGQSLGPGVVIEAPPRRCQEKRGRVAALQIVFT